MKATITKRLVDGTKAPASGTVKVYDDKLTGFGLVVYASGKKSFFLEYGGRGQQRRMVLGPYGALTVDSARDLALAALAKVAAGVDPLAEKQATTEDAERERAQRAAVLTFDKWRDIYVERVRHTKKQSRHDERYLAVPRAPATTKSGAPSKRGRAGREADRVREVAAAWGPRPLADLTRADVQAGMAAVAEHGHTTANRWLASVRACLEAATADERIPRNPAMGVKPYRENPARARVLTDEEFARVVAAFDALPDPHVRAAFVLLLDTGARKSEVLGAAWADFDLDGGIWRVPSPKAGHPQVVPLTESTVDFLRGVERLGPWLIPGRAAESHRADLRRAWDHIREEAALVGVTIHDLRRTFGLHIARKAGLHVASKLLRHSDVRVTERVYAPLGLDDLRSAAADTHRARGQVIELARAKVAGEAK